jgi:hypothetical protein
VVDLVGGAASRLYLPRAPATIPTQPIPISAGATAIGGTKLPSGEFILSSVNLLPRTGNYNDVVVFVLHTCHDWKRPARSRLLLPERMRHKVSLLLLSSGQLDRRRVLFTAARKARRVLRVVTTVKTRFDASRVSRVTRGAIHSRVGAKQCRRSSTTENDFYYTIYNRYLYEYVT